MNGEILICSLENLFLGNKIQMLKDPSGNSQSLAIFSLNFFPQNVDTVSFHIFENRPNGPFSCYMNCVVTISQEIFVDEPML